MGVQVYAYLSLGMWRANGNPNSCADLYKQTHSPVQGDFGAVLTPDPSSSGPWGPEPLRYKAHIFENCYKTKDVHQVAN